jgi:integrase
MSYTIYKQPRSQVWYYDLTVDGHRERKSTRTSDRKLAEEIASRREHELRRAAIYGPDSVLTFAVSTDSYLAAGKSDRFVAPVFEYFEKWRVRDITAGDIQEAARKLYPTAGPATRNRQVLAVVQAIINHSALAGLCAPIRVKRFKEPKVVRGAGSKKWLAQFCAHASPELAAMATLLFQGGARIGVAIALTWDDVNLRERRIIIPKDKNGDEFRIDLTTELTAMLPNLPKDRRKVFGYAQRWGVYGAWKTACRRAGVEYLSPHEAGRRGFATTMVVEHGVDLVTTAKKGDWKSTRMVERYVEARTDAALIESVFSKSTAYKARK